MKSLTGLYIAYKRLQSSTILRKNKCHNMMLTIYLPTTTLQLLFFEKFSKLAGISAT